VMGREVGAGDGDGNDRHEDVRAVQRQRLHLVIVLVHRIERLGNGHVEGLANERSAQRE